MSRKIKEKKIQVHFQCECGLNTVSQDIQPVRWKDFPKVGIVRKLDKKTNKYFLIQKINSAECHCFDGI